MRISKILIAGAALSLAIPGQTYAQDEGSIIVTGSRVDRSNYDRYYDDDQSAIGLTRKADYFVKPIYVSSDTREAALRLEELKTMLKETISLAPGAGIDLVAGSYRLQPVSIENMDDLNITSGRRPDTSRVLIYARIPVGGATENVKDADARIQAFIKSIPATGRSFIDTGTTGLAIDNPDQYRGAVVKAIAEESRRYAGMFGSDYGVEIRGLDSELYFKQASETEVFLFIEHSFIIKPK